MALALTDYVSGSVSGSVCLCLSLSLALTDYGSGSVSGSVCLCLWLWLWLCLSLALALSLALTLSLAPALALSLALARSRAPSETMDPSKLTSTLVVVPSSSKSFSVGFPPYLVTGLLVSARALLPLIL